MKLILIVVLTAFGSAIFAQHSSFSVTYTMKSENQMYNQMFSSSTTTITNYGYKSRVDMNMKAMGSTSATIIDAKTGNGLMLMEMMGKKNAVTIAKDDIEKNYRQGNLPLKFTGKTENIAGFNCKQVMLNVNDTTQIELWISEKLVPLATTSGYSYKGLAGFPLRMISTQMGVPMVFEASSVNTSTPDEALFNMTIPEGYTVKDFKTFSQNPTGN